MTKVIGVRFRTAGKIYYFSPGKFEIKQGDHVIVETARGVEYGKVVIGTRKVKDQEVIQPLKSVIRIATEQDQKTEEKNREKEKEAFQICLEKIRKHGLEMKLIDAEYTFDNNKVLFYFTADGRIDFRELVKDLAAVFRIRIERVESVHVGTTKEVQELLESCGSTPLVSGASLADLIRRPELSYEILASVDKMRPELKYDVAEQVNINIKYEGYIKRQKKQVEQFKKLEKKRIPADINYEEVQSLRLEAKQKLSQIRPASIGQASRISGVSPADISVLLVYLESR